MKNQVWVMRFILGLSTAVCLMSCNPKINDFSVWPLRICRGDTVHVSYDVTGQGTLEVVTKGNDAADTISYILIVERGGKKEFAQKDVIRWLAATEKELVFKTTPLGRDSVISIDTLRGESWKSGPPLGTLSTATDRPLWILHAGKAITLAVNGASTAVFEGLPAEGEWVIKAGLLPGEVMGDPQHSPPDRFRITSLFCKK